MSDQAPSTRASSRRRRWWPSATTRVVLLWGLLMFPLLWWGLPSKQPDDLLFGGEPAWKAAQYHIEPDVEQLRTRNAGADTQLRPLAGRDGMIDLTADDTARAEILRRYRLYSRQPDEMITLRALQRMNPRRLDFDPRLYQYGGGYIYLIGGALGASAALGALHVTPDAGFYLEHPDAFARFYIVARVVSLVFGALTLVAVSKLAARAAGRSAGWLAMLCTGLSPVFITAVLEAKPHLPSACLILWATLSALDYAARGRLRDAVRMGLQAGYAFGLVLTGLAAAALWPVLFFARPAGDRPRTLVHLAWAAAADLAVYLATNPYIPYNLLFNPAALTSNLQNSTAMYQDQMRQVAVGAVRVAELVVESAGIGVPVLGLIGLVLLLRRHSAAALLSAAPGLVILLLAALLGAGKPAEFARFLILPVVLLSIATAGLLATLARHRPVAVVIAIVFVLGMMHTPAYIRSFVQDARGNTESRYLTACYLRDRLRPADDIGLLQEPAPYAVPPLDFAHRRVLWLPPAQPPNLKDAELPAWLVYTADDDGAPAAEWWHAYYALAARFPPAAQRLTPVTWANKPVFIYRRAPSTSVLAPAAIPAE